LLAGTFAQLAAVSPIPIVKAREMAANEFSFDPSGLSVVIGVVPFDAFLFSVLEYGYVPHAARIVLIHCP
jgi:hypothetical protein